MRRKARDERIKNNRNNKQLVVLLLPIVLVLVLLSVCFVWLKMTNLVKFAVVTKTEGGGANVLIIDSKTDKVIKYKISPDEVLNSANGYGEYKLSSLWTLGQKEGLKGELVSRTIASNFLIPIYLWEDNGQSNLNFFQKIKFKLISKHDDSDDLVFDNFELPNSVLINFVNDKIQESEVKVVVEDLTGDPETVNKVSKIIGTIGTKVSGYDKGYDQNLDCEIYSKDLEIRQLLSKVFECKDYTSNNDNIIKIKLGAKFAQRF